jgi:hypothetical protein
VQQDDYYAAIPTVADSSDTTLNHIVLVVTTHTVTPSTWFVSSVDSGYSVDNIAPAAPAGFAAAYNTGKGNQLSWDLSLDNDFSHFRVYRSNDPEFVPSPAELVHSTVGTGWTDPEYDGWDVYYKITATDHTGNESEPSSPEVVTGVMSNEIPQTFALHQNVPNPFNPVTTIRYDVPMGSGDVMLRVYDVSGRLVRTLVNGAVGPGQRAVTWDGRNARGQLVATGVYFYRLTSDTFNKTRKMHLVK